MAGPPFFVAASENACGDALRVLSSCLHKPLCRLKRLNAGGLTLTQCFSQCEATCPFNSASAVFPLVITLRILTAESLLLETCAL